MNVNLRTLLKNWKSPFEKYLESDAWKTKEELVLQRDPICQSCQASQSAVVENRYVPMGQRTTSESVEDLMGVCKECQKKLPSLWAKRHGHGSGS